MLLWSVGKVQELDLDLFVPDSNFRYFFCAEKKNFFLNNVCFLLSCFNRLDTISNRIKTAFRVAKLKAELYREKQVTHNRTH